MTMAGAIVMGCAGWAAADDSGPELAALASSGPDEAAASAPEEVERPEPNPARRYPGRATHGPRAGFGVQYWGEDYTAEGLAAAPHCALILEASWRGADDGPDYRESLFDRAEVKRIRHGGTRPAYAYLNVAELAPHRDYWTAAFGPKGMPPDSDGPAPAWFGGYSAAGEPLAAYWTEDWAALLEAQLDAFVALGYDGVFLDDVLHYYTWADPGVRAHVAPPANGGADLGLPERAEAMMRLVLRLAGRARETGPEARRDFVVLVNGGPFIGWDAASRGGAPDAPHPLFEDYLRAIDGVTMESALESPTQEPALRALREGFANRGVPVLTIDFASADPATGEPELRARIAARAAEFGFLPYLAPDALFDRLGPPILPASLAPEARTASGCLATMAEGSEGGPGPR